MADLMDELDSLVSVRFKLARVRFAQEKTNRNAATLLRAACDAVSYDLIDEEEQQGVTFDIIEYLEQPPC